MALSPQAQQIQRWKASPATMVRELFKVEPDLWQLEVLEKFPSTPRIAMKASRGPGKAQPKDTIIPTPLGDRRFGDLQVGDQVFAGDGSITTVVAIHDRGILPVYRILFDDHASTLACGEHLWKVRGAAERMRKCATPYQRGTRSDEVWSILTTEEIIARGVRRKDGRWDQRQFEIPLHGAAKYPVATLPVDPYVLGVWLGDGLRGYPSYFKPDLEVERAIQRRGVETSRAPNDDRVRLLGISAELRQIECYEENSPGRFVPRAYKEAAPHQRRAILSGLMDTDGCIGDDGHMEFDSTSRRLAEDVVWLARSLGGNAFIKDSVKKGWYYGPEGEKIECRDCYRVTVRVPFNPFSIPRKSDRWKDPLRSNSTSRYMKRYIDSIEPAGEAYCMCIEVDHPDHLYLTNDFIVTHNTACLAWLAWNYLLTRPHPNIAATSISGDNLRDGLMKELAFWRNKSELLMTLFEWQTERVYLKEHPATWWLSARTWSQSANVEQLGNTLAGLHADYIMFLVDESGGIPMPIMISAEAALSSCVEGHIVQAGNTNSLDGALYAACVTQKHLWYPVVISGDPDDPKRSPRISIEWAREMIDTYGRDSPFVKVSVLGEWPSASINALLGPSDIEAAMKRQYQQHDIEGSPRILGVDIGRQGDDPSVIFPRQGLVAFPPKILRNVNGNVGAGAVARVNADWKPDAIFIDNTGGWGSSWIDQCQNLNVKTIPVGFADAPHDKRFYNRRAEIYFKGAEWIRNGGMLPNIPSMVQGLSAITYTFKGDRLMLEPKEIIKASLGRSIDEEDAWALTFSDPVAPRSVSSILPRSRREEKFDIFADYYR